MPQGAGRLPPWCLGMKRNVCIVLIVAAALATWYVGFTLDGQAMGRDVIYWMQSLTGD